MRHVACCSLPQMASSTPESSSHARNGNRKKVAVGACGVRAIHATKDSAHAASKTPITLRFEPRKNRSVSGSAT